MTVTNPDLADSNDFLIDGYADAGAVILAGGFTPETADLPLGKLGSMAMTI